MRRRYTSRRTQILIAGGLLLVAGVVASLFLIPGTPPRGRPAGAVTGSPRLAVKAYMVASGIFASPAAGQETADYLTGEATAKQNGQPLAHAIFTDQESFETRAWRDLIHVRRQPISRPPQIDFMREVAVVAWAAGAAPASLRHAPGLALHAADVQQHGIAVQLAPSVEPMPATPIGGGATLPYIVFSIPRDQWPIPVPPPDVPPMLVTLAA